jgi:predicted protein tyrosine phosphatase
MSLELPLIVMHRAAEDLVKAYPGKLNVISVTRDQPVSEKLCKNHLQIPIDDLDFENPEHQELGAKYKRATERDILNAVDFAKKHKVHIIHCGAGLSRSPAIAYAIFRSQGKSKEAAMAEVLKRVPPAIPNKWIVKLTDQIFKD